MQHNSTVILQTHTHTHRHCILHDTSTVQPQSQRTGRALQHALNIPGNLSGPFIMVGPLLAHPRPSKPRWASQRSTLWYAALFDYVRLRGLFRGMFTYRLHYTLAGHNESGMSESIIQSTLEDLDGRWPPVRSFGCFCFAACRGQTGRKKYLVSTKRLSDLWVFKKKRCCSHQTLFSILCVIFHDWPTQPLVNDL